MGLPARDWSQSNEDKEHEVNLQRVGQCSLEIECHTLKSLSGSVLRFGLHIVVDGSSYKEFGSLTAVKIIGCTDDGCQPGHDKKTHGQKECW